MPTYQSQFTGPQMDTRFAAVPELQEAITALEAAVAAKYAKPAGGIPSTDLDADVNAALAKALTAVQDLSNYYTKAETDAIASAISATVASFNAEVVASLPTASASTMGKFYLVGPDGDGEYDRYVTSYDGSSYAWVPAGTTDIDLSQYATKAELDQLDQKVDILEDGEYNTEHLTLANGTLANAANATCVNTSDYIAANPTDRVYLKVNKTPMAEGNYYRYAYRTYNGSKTQVRNITDVAINPDIPVTMETGEAYVRFVIGEFNSAGTIQTLRITNFDGSTSYVYAKIAVEASNIEKLSQDVEGVVTDIADIKDDLYQDIITPGSDITLTDANGYIVRKTTNKVEAGNSNQGILYFAVVAGKDYKILLNDLYCVKDYSTVSFCASTPAANNETTLIAGFNTTDSYTKTIHYRAVSNGYVYVLYNATNQKSRISAANETIETVARYEVRLKWSDKLWSAIGDSLTESNRTATQNYLDYIKKWTGIQVQNLGYGGTGYAKGDTKFGGRIASINPLVNVISIFGSFNDLDSGLPLGDVTDTGTDSICGYINDAIVSARETFPLVNIGIITPTPWAALYPGITAADNYVDALVNICKLQSVPCLDLYHCSDLRPWDAAFRSVAYTRDGQYSEATSSTPYAIQVTEDLLGYITEYGGLPNAQVGDWVVKNSVAIHPDEHGHILIAPRIKAFLETLIPEE